MKLDRRGFLSGIVGTAALPALCGKLRVAPVLAAMEPSILASDPRRPQYHLLPAANWMNDPNAPVYFNGTYHMFFQYNPHAAVWGDMHWDHAVSTDMVHWRHLPVALSPTPGGPDADGCFSGTAALVDGKVVILYTGVRSAPVEEATIKDGAQSLRETQMLATTDDPELKSWTKLPQPIIDAPPAGLQVNGFRDPSPWREGEWWYMVLGSGIANEGGAVLLYRSRDLRKWEYLHILAGRNGAQSLVPFDAWEVWECPEFFPLGDKHVLIYSTAGRSYWQSGVLDKKTMIFLPEHAGVLDYGALYAVKTQLDKAGNRVLWGWVTETRETAEYKAAGWAGMMSLPRVLTLGSDGRLRTHVAEEVKALRGAEQKLDLNAGEEEKRRQISGMRIAGYCGEILCTARRTQEPVQLTLQTAEGSENWLTVKYDPQQPKHILVDARPLPVAWEEKEDLEIHLYVDGSVMEVFINGQAVFTKRFYAVGSQARELRLQWTGKTAPISGLSVWQIAPISADRLTR
jgi:beta-fructofuranosidase